MNAGKRSPCSSAPTIGTSRGERPLAELVCVAPRENPDPGVPAEVAEESEARKTLAID